MADLRLPPRVGGIVAHVWGKRGARTAKRLRRRLARLGVSYGAIATDSWDSFRKVSGGARYLTGKQYTKGIEGNNCACVTGTGASSGRPAASQRRFVGTGRCLPPFSFT